MKSNIAQVLYWTPRAVSVLFIVFVSLFAFDVFEGSDSWWMKALGFLVHLTPSFALLFGLVIAWRWEWFGAVGYIGFGIWYVYFFHEQHWSAWVLLGVLPTVIGVLWGIGWWKREEIRKVRLLV